MVGKTKKHLEVLREMRSRAVLGGGQTVSYTHLDVYKRQGNTLVRTHKYKTRRANEIAQPGNSKKPVMTAFFTSLPGHGSGQSSSCLLYTSRCV